MPTPGFCFPQKVLFRHCDPAGIVFFPRYFEMINDATEAFFEDALGCPWNLLHEASNIPTVDIATQFTAPSRHGDALVILVEVLKIGNSSLSLQFQATCNAETRFTARSTLVHINKAGHSLPWPAGLRAAITPFIGEKT